MSLQLGWAAFPYIHGAWTAGFLALWCLFVTDKPKKPPPGAAAAMETEVTALKR